MSRAETPRPLLETNVYSVRGRVLVAGSCLSEAYGRLAAEPTIWM